jgi:hypothetical protein
VFLPVLDHPPCENLSYCEARAKIKNVVRAFISRITSQISQQQPDTGLSGNIT